MSHNKKLVLGGVSLTKARPNNFSMQVMREIRDELELIIIESNFIEKAPFKWIGLILRYGLINASKPEYKKINVKHGDLPVTIELNSIDLSSANKTELNFLFKKATLLALVDIAGRYSLESDIFEKLLSELTANDH